MRYSGYQLEGVLHQLARLVRERNLANGVADPVSLSEEGRARAPIVTLISEQDIPAADGTARQAVDPARYPAAVERELERRAGSFMKPPLAPEPVPIPKARPTVRPKARPKLRPRG
jgi:hypothetical protein